MAGSEDVAGSEHVSGNEHLEVSSWQDRPVSSGQTIWPEEEEPQAEIDVRCDVHRSMIQCHQCHTNAMRGCECGWRT